MQLNLAVKGLDLVHASLDFFQLLLQLLKLSRSNNFDDLSNLHSFDFHILQNVGKHYVQANMHTKKGGNKDNKKLAFGTIKLHYFQQKSYKFGK